MLAYHQSPSPGPGPRQAVHSLAARSVGRPVRCCLPGACSLMVVGVTVITAITPFQMGDWRATAVRPDTPLTSSHAPRQQRHRLGAAAATLALSRHTDSQPARQLHLTSQSFCCLSLRRNHRILHSVCPSIRPSVSVTYVAILSAMQRTP